MRLFFCPDARNSTRFQVLFLFSRITKKEVTLFETAFRPAQKEIRNLIQISS